MLLVKDDLYDKHIDRFPVILDGLGKSDDALKTTFKLVSQIPEGSLTEIHTSRKNQYPTR